MKGELESRYAAMKVALEVEKQVVDGGCCCFG